jgi:hypothetical protein
MVSGTVAALTEGEEFRCDPGEFGGAAVSISLEISRRTKKGSRCHSSGEGKEESKGAPTL